MIGCAAWLRKTGIPPDEANRLAAIAEQNIADAAAEAVQTIQEGIAQGKPLPAIATETATAFGWKLATIAASTIGAVLSALLAKWLGTERKITKALITGIEDNNADQTKLFVKGRADAAGIEPQLHTRVKALT